VLRQPCDRDGQGVWTNRNNNNNFGTVVVPSPAFPAFPATITGAVNQRLEWLATARLRAGFLATPALLIYGTGGAAFGGTRTTGFLTANNDLAGGTAVSSNGFANGTNTRVGWTAGGGLEWMFLPNWSLKGEALYYDLGTFNTQFSSVAIVSTAVPGAVTGSALTTFSHRERGIIARGGLNYHFGSTDAAPVVARY
jgi:outer membrane immunogenic protein